MGFTYPTAFFNATVALYRPTAAAFSTSGSTGTPTHTNDGLAYDTSTATFAELKVVAATAAADATAYGQIATYSGFTAVTFTGTLKVLVTSTTFTNTSGSATAVSSALVEYSLNGGSSWTTLGTRSGGTDWSSTLLTVGLTAQALGSLRVRCTAQGANNNVDVSNRTSANSTLDIYDIRVE